LINASLNTFSINVELFGWSTGSLVFVAILLFSGSIKKNEYLMLAVIAATLGFYSLYWFSGGPDFGARYWYLMLVPLVVLTVQGIWWLERTLASGSPGFGVEGTRAVVAVLVLSLLTVVNFFPWRAIDKYHHYLRMRPDIRSLAREYDFGKALVLIRGTSHPDYASAWIYNPLDPYADAPVYAWDQNPTVRAQLLHAYPDRLVWLVDGPTITQGAFKVVQGPLSIQQLAAKGYVRSLPERFESDH
jgi:hypothetical protein